MRIYFSSEVGALGGERRFLSREDFARLFGKMATRKNNWGADGNGEFAELPRPFRPPDIGSVALNLPVDAGEQVLEPHVAEVEYLQVV